MSARDAAGRELDRLMGALARARADVEAGRLVDLDGLDAGVRELCARVGALSVEEARGLRAGMVALTDDFGHLARAIEARLDALKRELGDTAERHQAVGAYQKSQKSLNPPR